MKRLRLSAVCVGTKMLQQTKIQGSMQIKSVELKVEVCCVTLRTKYAQSFDPGSKIPEQTLFPILPLSSESDKHCSVSSFSLWKYKIFQ